MTARTQRPRIVLLPGDCIGPEVMAEARRVLPLLCGDVEVEEELLGARAIEEHGTPLPESTLRACKEASAVLKAPIGDPRYDHAEVRPEPGLFQLRRELGVYVNLRPAVDGDVDLIIVRELLGGIYYGTRGTRADGTVFDTCEYHPAEVRRIATAAFELALERRGRVTSVDKANVLETSRMWRRVVTEVAQGWPEIELDHMLVDNAAMQLVQRPEQFDVIVTDNMFGDILSDEAAGLTGGLGAAGSASLSESGPGLFEPVHGSAPDIAGAGIANPVAMLRSTALLLRYGLRRPEAAAMLDQAIDRVNKELRTPDAGGTATTRAVGDAIVAELEGSLETGAVAEL